jgi:hypothetical protein
MLSLRNIRPRGQTVNLTTPLSLITAALLAAGPAAPTTNPASNTDEPNSPVGKRPYELDWAGRTQPEHPQLVGFEDLTGWEVRCRDGAQAGLYRSKQEVCFGDYSAKAVYSGTSPNSTFVIAPPRPISVPGKPTAINLWVRGNNWGWVDPPETARTEIHVLIRDSKDGRYAVDMGTVDFDYWFLLHGMLFGPTGRRGVYHKITEKSEDLIHYPIWFEGIEVSSCSNEKPARLYFDALSFYETQYAPLKFEPPPEKLPWPTTPDTILPTCKKRVGNEVRRQGAAYELTATETAPGGVSDSDSVGDRSGPATSGLESPRRAPETIRYRYEPNAGQLSDITVEAGGQRFWPCWNGGVEFELGGKVVRPGSEGTTVRLLSCRRSETPEAQAKGDRAEDGPARPDGGSHGIVAEWEIAVGQVSARYRYEIRIKGKSLIVDVTATGGLATRFDIGLAKGLDKPKAIYIPYLTYGMDWPRVVCSAGRDAPVFALGLLDYYNSDASSLYGTPRLQEKDAIAYNGGAFYEKKTDGRRNDLRERLLINVSRDFREVLPNIPNPRCDTGEVAREYLWRNIGHPQPEMLARYKAYGIDKFIACHHEVGWRDAGESFTMRLRAAPRITDDGLARYSEFVRGLGYRFGTYTNYVDFAPVNSNWNEDDVCLNPDGTWQRAWPRCYALKPLRAVEKEAYYAPRIHEKFGTNAQYCDVHTAYTPWGRTDYDARTPGAGMFRTQFNAFARLLWNESKAHHGPVFSEGCHQWFYAGIVDGDYGQMVPYGTGHRIEPIVDFDLLKMHPLMTDFGMGMPGMYYGERGDWMKDRSRLSPYFDKFHTSTIAFGHIGFLADEWGLDGTLKSYFLLQALQQRYAMVPVKRIGYFDGTRIVDSSTALITDAYKRRQINVLYENGLEVWANLSPEKDWTVRVDDKEYLLAPYGFVAREPNDILAYSAIVGDARHELVQCRDYLYLDSRGQIVRTPVITARGAVVVKPDGKSAWWIIPATKCEEVTVSTDWLGCDTNGRFTAAGHNESGKQVSPAEVRRGARDVTVIPAKGAIKYRLVAEPDRPRSGQPGRGRPGPEEEGGLLAWKIDVPRRELVKGSTLPVRATFNLPAGSDPASLKLFADWVPPSETAVTLGQARSEKGHVPGTATAEIDLKLPPDQRMYERCWYRLRLISRDGAELGAHWIDVTAVPAFDLSLRAESPVYQRRRGMCFRIPLKSHLPDPVELTVVRKVPQPWSLKSPLQTVRVEPGKTKELRWVMHGPPEPVVFPVSIEIRCGKVSHEHTWYIRTRPTDWIVADLTRLGMSTGECIRGGSEQSISPEHSGATVQVSDERVGEQSMPSVFMHPPYQHGVGYAFAAIPLSLPGGRVQLSFALGFRDGSTTTDGCLFKVIVLDGDKATEVFAHQYAVRAKWESHKVDLSPFAGKRVTLKLVTDVGPADDSNSDWACWGQPQLMMGDQAMAVEVHEARPPDAFLPPPEPLPDLTAADLGKIASAEVTLEGAGVNGGQYASFIYFNDIKIGTTPESNSDTVYSQGKVLLLPEAIKTIGPDNRLVIRNPGGDWMKVRNLCLHFTLSDGRRGSSWIDIGPYTSAAGWPHQEGTAVPLGADLPTVWLTIPTK